MWEIEIVKMEYEDDFVNSVFLHDGNKLVIVDTGIIEKKKMLIDLISKYDFKKLFVILTHSHFDHIGNNYLLKKNFNPAFISSRETAKLVKNKEHLYSKFHDFVNSHYKFDSGSKQEYLKKIDGDVDVDIIFTNDLILNGKNSELYLVSLPGHTKGDIGIIIRENKVMILSELVFNLSRKILIFIEDYQQMISSLKKIKKIITDEKIEKLITSHFEKIIEGRGKILEMVDGNIKYIKELRSKVIKMAQKDLNITEATRNICEKYNKNFNPGSIITVKALLK